MDVGGRIADDSRIISVEGMDLKEGFELAQKILPNYAKLSLEEGKTLLELLNHHPLAISQVCWFMAIRSMAVSDYVQLFQESSENQLLLLSGEMDSTRSAFFYTLLLSFDRIKSTMPRAADILYIMSMLDSQKIPRSLILELDAPLNDPAQNKMAIRFLMKSSLIQYNIHGKTITLHKLVHLATNQ
ncbi:MAG: hypothetical protein M1834_005544 [Cirrosporium novae-zelandiae]|nr:MAG: hypothetical protein M1834_005544 [Cirrosporium novae-zelandiae]